MAQSSQSKYCKGEAKSPREMVILTKGKIAVLLCSI